MLRLGLAVGVVNLCSGLGRLFLRPSPSEDEEDELAVVELLLDVLRGDLRIVDTFLESVLLREAVALEVYADAFVDVLRKDEAVLRKDEEMEDAVERMEEVRLSLPGG